MTTRWDPEISMARPPARRPVDWLNVLVWIVLPGIFWGVVVLILYLIGVI